MAQQAGAKPPTKGAPGTSWNDPKTPGLRLRFLETKAVWYLYFRTKAGRQRNMKLADESVLTLTAARDRARALLEAVARGEDPAQDMADLATRATLQDLRNRHIEEHAGLKNKAKWKKDQEALWDKHVLPFLKPALAVEDVTENQIGQLHHKMRRTPFQANRCMAMLHKAFNLAEKWGMRPRGTNPVTVERYPEKKRKRKPHAEEAIRLLSALDGMRATDPHFVGLVELLCLTGARLDEVKSARWDWVKPDGLHLPDSKTGEKVIALSSHARDVLAAIPKKENNPYIICGRRHGRPLVNVSKPWARLMKAASIEENLRRHDLRRFFASAGLSSGLGLSQVGDLLGHMEPATTKRYAFLLTDAAQELAEQASQGVRNIMTGGGKVTHLRVAGAGS
ncbi:site-specific integrase [Aureimonas sp. AU40]|uniref:site-specific integrase n=1 Tax=Aureimonas sp. AU40 TaxID=1637747 RepID=UPI0009EA593D|nr:site-specific integrase [Aureimonas sp. AU40]